MRKFYYLLVLSIFLVSCNKQPPVSPCENLPHSTKEERADKALCEIGEFVTKNKKN